MYALFDTAERKNMTVAKLVTGKDKPITNIEMTLYDTFRRVTGRFEEQAKKEQSSGSRHR